MAHWRSRSLAPVMGLVCFLLTTISSSSPWYLASKATVSPSLAEQIIQWRRDLHQIPELAYQEVLTSRYIRDQLFLLNITYHYPVAGTGIVAQIGSGSPVVAFRAEMDALPISEPEGLPYRSRFDGRMHACGHDSHMAMLLGAAKILQSQIYEDDVRGTVRLIFQPAEEGGAGAKLMADAGAVQDVDYLFSVHVQPLLPSGTFSSRSGILKSAAASFSVTVRGRGGHAAVPELAVDPIVAAAAIITSLQTVVSRRTPPLASAVVSVGTIHAGDAPNVIPDSVTFQGTVRASSTGALEAIAADLQVLVSGLAAACGCTAVMRLPLTHTIAYPALYNSPAAITCVEEVLTTEFQTELLEAPVVMQADDLAFFAEKVDTALVYLGIGNQSLGTTALNHSPMFRVDESVLRLGTQLLASLAHRALSFSV